MYFDYTQEQYLLRDSVRDLFSRRLAPAQLRTVLEGPDGFCRDTWRDLASLGLLWLLVPEAHGGAGMSLLDLALVLEEAGYHCLPAPLADTAIAFAPLVSRLGDAAQRSRWLEPLGEGSLVPTLALYEADGAYEPDRVQASARRDGDGYILAGEKAFVPFAEVADVFLVTAIAEGEGVGLFLVPRDASGVTVEPQPSLDLSQRVGFLSLDGVRLPASCLLGTPGPAVADALAATLDALRVGLAADMIGAGRRVLDMTLEHVRTRQQFDRPIGSFQAVKHKAADMKVQLEVAEAALRYAVLAVTEGYADAPQAVATAKALAHRASRFACAAGLQLHGGMGFTWEHDLHFFLKRAKRDELLLGDTAWQLERLAAVVIDGHDAPVS